VITVNGERIGVVGATTPTLPSISSPGGVTVLPEDFDANDPADIAALAAQIQSAVDDLLAENPDIDKVVLLAHMQQISIEQQLAGLLRNVDIIVAGGSNTILADDTDRLRAGDEAEGPYPILSTAADGNPIAIVNTDGNYRYVGRLVVDFDDNGVIIPDSVDPTVSGAYATDEAGVQAVNGTPDPEVVEVTNALQQVIEAQDGNIFGNSSVFLNGTRGDVRTQETNLGNLTADANLAAAREVDDSVVISIKNGGGIRDNIGVATFPAGSTDPDDLITGPTEANPVAGKEAGDISQLDIANSLRFNNGLTLLTVTAEELQEIIEYAVSASEAGATPGQFPQVSGISFSFDPDLPAGDRVQSLAIKDEDGNIVDTVVENGELVGDPTRTFRLVTLGFLADGGDGYPFPDRDRVDLVTEDSDNPDPSSRTGQATFAADGSEQDALAEYLADNFSDTSFDQADVGPEEDDRIQNLNFRDDTVLDVSDAPDTNDATLLDFTDLSGTVDVEFSVSRNAAFDNFVGFYRVVNTNGGIDVNGDGTADLNPGDAGYTAAAVANRVSGLDLTTAAGEVSTFSAELMGGALYAPFLIANGRPEDSATRRVFFAFSEANLGGLEQVRGNNTTFGFEDVAFGGDRDFDDLVVQATVNSGL
jgi:2',3'-cyclic-nucleotide 2'-phosphodiesterase / 3'-nucleotidase / 5'-nucleotidase